MILNHRIRKFLTKLARPRGNDLRKRYPEYNFGVGTYGDLVVRSWGEGAKLEVGAYCSIASNVQILLGGGHRTDWITTYPFNVFLESFRHIKGHPSTRGDVIIGSDVWIGSEVVVLSGVKVGDGAVIGARAVVSKDVEPYEIVSGNPAAHIRYRFDDEVIEKLLQIQWWTWSDEKLMKAIPDLLSDDLTRFIEEWESGSYDA